jgi:hypothetical protein
MSTKSGQPAAKAELRLWRVIGHGDGALIRPHRGGLTSALIEEPGLAVCALYVVGLVIVAGVMALMPTLIR